MKKRFISVLFIFWLICSLPACADTKSGAVPGNLQADTETQMSAGSKTQVQADAETQVQADAETGMQADTETQMQVDSEIPTQITEETENTCDDSSQISSDEEITMKLYFNDTEIPVIWEKNKTVAALMAEVESGDIVVEMSMYGGWEQVGPLGRSYTRDDRQITAQNGDIVLYSGNQIVVFYGSNSWAYTRLGKMNLPEDEVTDLLSGGDITLTLSK